MKIFVNILRLLVALLFILSGLIKVNDVTGFMYKLEEYLYVFSDKFHPVFKELIPFSLPMAIGISYLEVILSCLLFMGLWRNFTTFFLLLLIIFFTWLTGYSAITQSVTDCGCFGDAIKLTPWQSFYKDVILLLAILLMWIQRKHIQPALNKPLPQAIYFTIVTLLTAGAIAYCFYYLPIIDFRPYKVGTDLNYTTTHRTAEGSMIAKDYTPFKSDCDTNELKGNVLLVIMYDMAKANPKDLDYSVALAQQLKEANILVLGATSTPSDERKKVMKKHNIKYCVSSQDLNMLKTMIRSNPGYILLHNGVVKAQWHANHKPTRTEIFAKLEH